MSNPQNMQHFISNSPWRAQQIFQKIQEEVKAHPKLQEGFLDIDESGTEKSGNKSAGASRQYIGRRGKVDLGQVGVCAGYYREGAWIMVDAQLYLPKEWFKKEKKQMWESLHIPEETKFQTKIEIAFDMVKRARNNGIPFKAVAADGFYGKDATFRSSMHKEGIHYICAVPQNTQVYLKRPKIGIPRNRKRKLGRRYCKKRVLGKCKKIIVSKLAQSENISFTKVFVRNAERGMLIYECYAQRVFCLTEENEILEEWLLICKEEDGSFSYSLCNAKEDISLQELAQWRASRYFAERIFQDSKSELGWDELMARKYRSFMHHSALSAMGLWFMMQVKLEWESSRYADKSLLRELGVLQLPAISMANIRLLLLSVLPLKALSPPQAIELVAMHFFSRSLSTKSRLNQQKKICNGAL